MSDKFEIIFLDPPFADKNYLQELKLLKQMKNYKRDHIVIIHREKKTSDDFQNILEPIIIKRIRQIQNYFWKIFKDKILFLLVFTFSTTRLIKGVYIN